MKNRNLVSYFTIICLTLFNNGNRHVSGSTANAMITYNVGCEYKPNEFKNSSISNTEVPNVSEHDVKLINKSVFTKMACEPESRGKYNVANEFGYVGKYQMGRIAFRDIGYSEGWIDTVRASIYTVENSKGRKLYYFDTTFFPPAEQELAICKYFHKIEKRYLRKDIEKYVGKTIDGVYITKAGILGASMLGCGYVDKFLKRKGKTNSTDAYGTSVKSRLVMFEDVELNSCF
jgi:hypothetical protein